MRYEIVIETDETDREELLNAIGIFLTTKMNGAKLISLLRFVSEEELVDVLTRKAENLILDNNTDDNDL